MHRRLLSSLAGLAVLTMPVGATAQQEASEVQTEPPREVIEQRLRATIDSLAPLSIEAREAAEVEARLRDEAARRAASTEVDTLHIGSLRIIALAQQSDLAEQIFSELWEGYTHFAESPALGLHWYTFQWGTQFEPIYVQGSFVRRIEHRRWRSRAYLRAAAERSIGATLSADLSVTRLGKEWVNGPILAPNDLSISYRELAAVPSKVSQACLAGDGDACWSALALDVDEGTSAQELLGIWYTPQERVELVRRQVMRWGARYATLPENAPCVIERNVTACDEMIAAGNQWHQWTAPLGTEARLAMIWFAVEAGGDGAWERLIADPEASASEALQAASGLSREELGELWHRRVLEHRPTVYAGALPAGMATLFWTVLFAAVAMRSTRWRLG